MLQVLIILLPSLFSSTIALANIIYKLLFLKFFVFFNFFRIFDSSVVTYTPLSRNRSRSEFEFDAHNILTSTIYVMEKKDSQEQCTYSLLRGGFLSFDTPPAPCCTLQSTCMVLRRDRRRPGRLALFTMGPHDFDERRNGGYRRRSSFAPLYVLLHYEINTYPLVLENVVQ